MPDSLHKKEFTLKFCRLHYSVSLTSKLHINKCAGVAEKDTLNTLATRSVIKLPTQKSPVAISKEKVQATMFSLCFLNEADFLISSLAARGLWAVMP